jgi:nucleotide-binding universal stress UspA family protein
MPARVAAWCDSRASFEHVLVPLDGSAFAEQALPLTEMLCQAFDTRLTLVSAIPDVVPYLSQTAQRLREQGLKADYAIGAGSVVEATATLVHELGIDLVVTSTRGGSGARHWLTGGVASRIVQAVSEPVLLVQSDPTENGRMPQLNRLLVTLDGSERAERVIPYAMALANAFQSEVLLLFVPEVPEAMRFGAVVDWVETMRTEAEIEAWKYLDSIMAAVHDDCPAVRTIVTGSRPATAISDVSAYEGVDMIMMATRGRGGLDRLWMGSVAERVVQQTQLPVFLLPVPSVEAADQRLAVAETPTATPVS